jgi:hypothetical protein
MPANISFTPSQMTNASGLFNASSSGYIQGFAEDDPAVRFALSGGVLASTETLPMWAGVGISLATPGVSGNPASVLGPLVSRATSLGSAGVAGSLSGFSVSNQNYSGIITPQSQVPLVGSGGQVNFYRLGSGARIPVACAASLVSSLPGNIETQQVSWDFANQQLIPYEAAFSTTTITGATWANTSGGQATFTVGTNLTSDLSAGDIVTVTGINPTGYNGAWAVVSVSSSTVVVTLPAASTPGSYVSGGSIVGGGGALPVKLLRVNVGNSMVVSYNASSNQANWTKTGSCAVILI